MRAGNRTFISGTTASRRGWMGRVTLAAAIVLAGSLGACAGKHANDTEFVKSPTDRAADLAKAQRLMEQAYNAQKDEDYQRAINLYAQALQIDSSLGAAWHNAGICFMEENRFLDARDAFRRAGELLATDPRPYENLGVLYLRQGFGREAYEAYGRALERNPYSVAALRGSTRSIKSLRLVSTDAQSRLQRGLEVETDTRWREIMSTERIRVEAGLREEARR